ncbi:hypothetical protein ACS0TY_010840 [Phlomoides rotata]
MAKRRRGLDSGGTVTEMTEFNTVFVDTSLDTHLAMLVSSSDTVSDFRKNMALEHKHCFPTVGEIQVLSVKVERRSNFYHLPDIMLLWSAFHGEEKGNWFLLADVSGAHTCNSIKNHSELNTSNGVKMGVLNDDDKCRDLSPDVNRILALPMPLLDGATEKTLVSEMIDGIRFEKSVEKTTEFQSKICSEKECLRTDSHPRKKRKIWKTEDECHNRSSGDACALFQASGKDTSKPEIVSCANLMADSVKESPGGVILTEQNGKYFSGATAEVSVVRNDHFEETSAPTTEEKSKLRNAITSPDLLASIETKQDNLLEGKMDDELAQDAPTKHSDGVSVIVPDHVARSMDARGGVGEINTDGSKWKKKKVLTTARKLQDSTDMEQTGKGETMKTCSETLKSDLKEKEKGSSLEKNLVVVMPSNNKASDHLDPVSMLKESSFSRDADAVMEPEISSGIKKKKKKKTRQKKSLDTNLENSVIDQTDNCISSSSGLLLLLADHIPDETCKGEGIRRHDEKDAQMMLDSSTLDAAKKVQGVNRNEVADSVTLTQTEQASEDGVSVKKKADKSNQSSSGKCHADIHTVQTENPVMEFNEVDKGNENTGNKDRKASKKKKQKLTGAEVQVNLLGEDQQVGVDALATKETSISVVNSEQGRQVDSSQVLYSKTGENSNKIHGIAENTDEMNTTSEKEGEGINFKQYFVTGQDQHKEDSGDKVKKAIKSKKETSKRVKDNDLPFVSNSAELQNSFKSLVNKKTEKKSHRSDNTRSKGGSVQNSDRNEVISNSIKKSSGASEEGGKDYSPRFETTLRKPDDSLAASSRLNKKTQTLDKSTSVRSEVSPRKQGNRRLESVLDVTNMIPMKSPQTSLFTKSGPIFQERSDGRSGDENGTMHKPGERLTASSFLNKKYQISDKSTSARSEVLPRKQGNIRLQSGLNVTNMTPMKTPQKKSLLTKPGAIFQDYGGESSGGENGAMHSDGYTVCPSDSSSMSGNSVGGSDLSQDSTRNGGPTGGRNMSKLELSASTELTMDMILRSSKRFKKAKLLASKNDDEKNESQAIEFVPDSQLS